METTKSMAPQATQAIFISNQAIQAAVVESPSPSQASSPLTPMPAINPTESNASKEEKLNVFGGGRRIGIEDLKTIKGIGVEKKSGSWLGRFNTPSRNLPSPPKTPKSFLKQQYAQQQQQSIPQRKAGTS